MSKTNDWAKRLETHRWSQDDRTLAYKFQQQLQPMFEKFYASNDKQMSLGPYDLENEPWRAMTVRNLARSFGAKIGEKELLQQGKPLVEFLIQKMKITGFK